MQLWLAALAILPDAAGPFFGASRLGRKKRAPLLVPGTVVQHGKQRFLVWDGGDDRLLVCLQIRVRNGAPLHRSHVPIGAAEASLMGLPGFPTLIDTGEPHAIRSDVVLGHASDSLLARVKTALRRSDEARVLELQAGGA